MTRSTLVAKEEQFSSRSYPSSPRVVLYFFITLPAGTHRVLSFLLSCSGQELSHRCHDIFCFVPDERPLQRRHANSATIFDAIAHDLLHLLCEGLHLVGSIIIHPPIFIKVREERSGLLWHRVVNERCQVDTARPDECGIESVDVVRREEYDPLFARGDTVQSVEES